jgi:hypothetical protein
MGEITTTLSFIRDHYIDEVIGKNILPSVIDIPQTGNPIAVVCDFFLRKSTKTLKAICTLCETGFSEDALILGRTIFELGLHLQTIASADSVEKRQHNAQCFIYDGERQRQLKLNELEELKRQGKCLSWINEFEALTSVAETVAMPDGFIQPPSKLNRMASKLGGDWECLYRIIYWSVSTLTHPSGLGSHTYIQDYDQEEEASRAIAFALTTHYFLTGCVLNLLTLESLHPQLEECLKTVMSLSRSAEAG